jgi:hypothetical protein
MKYISIFVTILAMACSCTRHTELPHMPMQLSDENSLMAEWAKKEVKASIQLSGMETMGSWEHRGFGTLEVSERQYKEGSHALLITSPTKGPGQPARGRVWGESAARFMAQGADWSEWDRVTFWVYPDLPGFHVVTIGMVLNNEGADKVPGGFWRGENYQTLQNQQWNKVYWEIASLGRDSVSSLKIYYHLAGNEPGASDTARYYIDDLRLEKVEADKYGGWDATPGMLTWCHSGYVLGRPKLALSPDPSVKNFTLVHAGTGKEVFTGNVASQYTPLGTFSVMDFSGFNKKGSYVLQAGGLRSKPFPIGDAWEVYRNSAVKTLNFFYSQRCGYPIEGKHGVCHEDWVARHDGDIIHANGGWHDAGDLTQNSFNTSNVCDAMFTLAEKLRETDPVLSARLLEEARWGVEWLLKTRFDDGYRMDFGIKSMWTDNIDGTPDDFDVNLVSAPHAGCIIAEAKAALAFTGKDDAFAARALKCAVADFDLFTRNLDVSASKYVETAGFAVTAALDLYSVTKNEKYLNAAIQYADYVITCQEQGRPDIPMKGFFYSDSTKHNILHYDHFGWEYGIVTGLVQLAKLLPQQAAQWEDALRLYADYYKEIANYTAPYYMLPAGIYEGQDSVAVRLSDRYYLRRFPPWWMNRGNSNTTLAQARGLAAIANHFGDRELLHLAECQLQWNLGLNPFSQSLMYGEGYRYPPFFNVFGGNVAGALPVGIETKGAEDTPYWPADCCYTYKEVWVNPSDHWLRLMSDMLE